jgi:brefeldin A-resistance guanine nucleotide exchange factor 1
LNHLCIHDAFCFLCSLLQNASDMVITADEQGAFMSDEANMTLF